MLFLNESNQLICLQNGVINENSYGTRVVSTCVVSPHTKMYRKEVTKSKKSFFPFTVKFRYSINLQCCEAISKFHFSKLLEHDEKTCSFYK